MMLHAESRSESRDGRSYDVLSLGSFTHSNECDTLLCCGVGVPVFVCVGVRVWVRERVRERVRVRVCVGVCVGVGMSVGVGVCMCMRVRVRVCVRCQTLVTDEVLLHVRWGRGVLFVARTCRQ